MLMTSFIMSKLGYCNVALAGLLHCDLDLLQSVINAATRLRAAARRNDPITPLLVDLHWLQMPQKIQYKLCILVYRCLHGSAPGYLQSSIIPVSDTASRRRLCSASSGDLVVPSTRRLTIGDRAFAVAGPRT